MEKLTLNPKTTSNFGKFCIAITLGYVINELCSLANKGIDNNYNTTISANNYGSFALAKNNSAGNLPNTDNAPNTDTTIENTIESEISN